MTGRRILDRWEADRDLLLIGNLILFIITFISFFLGKKGLKSSNPHAFVRSVYTSMMLKLFACAIAAFIYIASNRDNVNKPALFMLMGFYLVYTFIEVSILTKMLRQKSNG
jgi:FtsH-binding integral membrane protein